MVYEPVPSANQDLPRGSNKVMPGGAGHAVSKQRSGLRITALTFQEVLYGTVCRKRRLIES